MGRLLYLFRRYIMVKYEYCLTPMDCDKRFHNYKVFVGDTVEIFGIVDGMRMTGKIVQFHPNSIEMDDGFVVPLEAIKDINVISRADGKTDWR